MRARVALLAALVLAGCLSTSGSGADDGKDPEGTPVLTLPLFTMVGTNCRELLLQASIPVAAARAFVPDGYTIQGEATGRAVAFAALKMCDDLHLDDASIGPASTSDVGVLLDSPDGSDGIHYYQTWWITDNPDLWNRLEAMGWRGALVQGTSLDAAITAGLAGTVRFEVPWPEGAYAVEAPTGQATIPPANTATGWQDTPNGTARVIKILKSNNLGGGVGTLTADAGSPMADLMGASARGPALWNVYDMDGVVVLGEMQEE